LRIQSIHLTNFRNFANETVELGSSRNLILGRNAQGKTNVLEAIHLLGVGRSHRDRKDARLVRFGESFYRVEGRFDHIGVRTTVEVSYGEERRRIRLNGKDAKATDLIGLVGIVISSPDDISLVKGSPKFRRTFMDMAISQISKEYLHSLQQYVRSLAQRNRLLKSIQEKRVARPDISAWDEKVIETGARIVNARVKYLGEIRSNVEENFNYIGGSETRVSLRYEPKGYEIMPEGDVESALAMLLESSREMEMARGHSLFGPHLDDFGLLSDDRDIRLFGSEGEQRTAVLALRCAEVWGMKERTGRYPIVLLDDVFAELDETRSGALTALISGFDQIILTASRPARMHDQDIHRILIEDGKVSKSGKA
jgi:DNA replication and repair protein RecF